MSSPVTTMILNASTKQSYGVTTPGASFTQFPYVAQTPNPPPQQFHQPTPQLPSNPPTWAVQILEDITLLKQSLPNIDNIEKTVGSINVKMAEIETKMKQVETRITESENSCSCLGNTTDKHEMNIKSTKKELETIISKCEGMSKNMSRLEEEKQRLNAKVTNLESRSKKDHLLFYELQEQRDESCETVVRDFVRETLDISDEIVLDRAHRLGSNSAKKPRPIVAKFHYHQQREQVRQKSYAERQTLSPQGYGVGIQFPNEVREKRKVLNQKMKEAERHNKTVRLVYDKLYIDGAMYDGDRGQGTTPQTK